VSDGPVLCAFDASEPSLLAARVACWLAGALDAPLELVYVVDHDELPALPRSGERIDPYTRSALYEISGALAAEAPCPLVVVASDDAVSEPGPVLVGDDGSEHALRAVRHAESLAARLDRDLVRLHIEDGDAIEGLVRAAHEQRACVVVTGTRGRGPLRGELLGSVSTDFIRDAGRQVMLVSEHAEAPT
jgi:nucleotide-binding universal stress UspA family protein